MNPTLAKDFAQKIFTGLAMAHGGHSQVSSAAYGEAAVGQLNNNTHWHSGVSQAEILEFYGQIINQLVLLVDEYWMDWEGCEEVCKQIRESASKSIIEFLDQNF